MKRNRSLFKIQGSKFKLLDQIEKTAKTLSYSDKSTWIEPFMGSGTVGLNIAKGPAEFYDVNPYMIEFFNLVKSNQLTSGDLVTRLKREQQNFSAIGADHFYSLREKFNLSKCPVDFFILNRTTHSGLVRFSKKKQEFNAPYCRNDSVITDSLVRTLAERLDVLKLKSQLWDWKFEIQDFETTLKNIQGRQDVVTFLDPPYIERNPNYFTGWGEESELSLFNLLKENNSPFILTTWVSNEKKSEINPFFKSLWSKHFKYKKNSHKYIVNGIKKDGDSLKINEAILYSK
jgi:DNA adenine methylase